MPRVRRAFARSVVRPIEVKRGRVQQLLADRADIAARFLCAPVGSGKTTALRQYARHGAHVRYVRVAPGMTLADLRGVLEDAPDGAEIALDDLDVAEPAAVCGLMADLIAGDRSYPPLIISGRSRGRLQVQQVVARGLGAIVNGRDLAFDSYELQELAELFKVPHGHDEVAELLQVTEGWPVAVTWIVREAASARAGLLGAFERWADRHGHLLIELVAESLSGDAALRRAFLTAIASETQITQNTLAELELAGCPIARLRTRLRPYRILPMLARPQQGAVRAAAPSAEPLAMTLLGKFSCSIGDRQVVFARRRDQNLLTYVALAPEGRATREELLSAFWPGVARTVASQGLRTTLSRLRRAIAEAAQGDADHYLRVDANIALVLGHVSVDARRFVEHVMLGQLDDARSDTGSARRHFRTACNLYKDHLLSSEAIETPLEPRVQEFQALFESGLSRLVELTAMDSHRERDALAVRLRSLRTTA